MGILSWLLGLGKAAEKAQTFLADTPAARPAGQAAVKAAPGMPSGSFKAKEPLEIRYINFQNVERRFIAEKFSVRPARRCISVQVEPTGRRITLKPARIQNMGDLQPLLELFKHMPSANEARILRFHSRRGSSSELFDQLKGKYGEWMKRML